MLYIDIEAATATFECCLNSFNRTRFFYGLDTKAIRHYVEQFVRPGGCGDLALHMHTREAAGRQPLLKLFGAGVAGQLNREGHHDTVVTGLRALHDFRIDGLGTVMAHRLRGLLVEQLCRTCVQQLQVVVELRHGAHGRA